LRKEAVGTWIAKRVRQRNSILVFINIAAWNSLS
jgi:hypothetical protein